MKRMLCLFLALILAVGICFSAPVTITASAAYDITVTIDTGASVTLKDADGDGYYDVGNADELYAFATAVKGGKKTINVELTADITINENVLTADGELNGDGSNFRVWTPIGYYNNQNDKSRYSGTFHGNDKTISGLYYNNSNVSCVGLFGTVDYGGKIENVSVIDSYTSGSSNVGGVVGSNGGTVTNCYNKGTVSGSSSVGGVVGSNRGTVTNGYNEGNVSGTGESVGGVVGDNRGTVTNCYNKGAVSGSSSVGGVVGYSDDTVTNCYNEGNVSGTGSYVGGVVGYNLGTVTNCYNEGNVSGSSKVGGVVGYNLGTVTNCYNKGTVSGTSSVGGVVGSKNGGTVTNCYNEGVVSGTGSYVGGVVGCGNGKNCYYLSGCATDGNNVTQFGIGNMTLGSTTADVSGQTDSKTADWFTSGEVCAAVGYHQGADAANGFCDRCIYDPATLNEDGYYEISNAGQLFWFADYINTEDRTANAVLTADIDLENRPWTPIGKTDEESNNFRGHFDGQNHTIKGLYIERSTKGIGFFGEVRTGIVENFTIYGEVNVKGECDYVGGVFGSTCGLSSSNNELDRNGAIIRNITSYVNLTAGAHGIGRIGGFVGYANHQTLIENCSWYGTFDAGSYRVDTGAGGFIGNVHEGSNVTIRNCAAYGTIKTNYKKNSYDSKDNIYMGGFLSYSESDANTTLENCLFAGKFEKGENLTDQALLGAFGTLKSVNSIVNCYYLGDDGLEAVHSDSTLKPGSDNVEITSVTKAQLLSGEVAYKLQGEENTHFWGQTIGTDDYPVLGGDKVYYGYISCADDAEMVYTNNENAVTEKPKHTGGTASCKEKAVCENCGDSYGDFAPHTYENGKCTAEGCGYACTHENNKDENGICTVCCIADGTCGASTNDGGESSVEWLYDSVSKTLTITGSGAMADEAPWEAYRESIRGIDIKDGVTSIGIGAFCGCVSLTSVMIPGSVKTIGVNAFSGCESLLYVRISEGVTSIIGDGAFKECTELKEITIPESVTAIGKEAFNSCQMLTTITIPKNVTVIGEGAFGNCTRLTEINVDEGNTNYSSEAGVLFNADKTKLICYPAGKKGDYEVPTGVTEIADFAFSSHEESFTVTIPVSVTTIGARTFECSESVTLTVEPGSEAHKFAKTNSIPYIFNGYSETDTEQIEKLTFALSDDGESYSVTGCDTQISGELKIPATYNGKPVTEIGNNAFANCILLKSVTIPDSITTIGEGAFRGCIELMSITIPESVTVIGSYAFDDCAILASISVDSVNTKYSSEYGVLFNKNKTELICYPAGQNAKSYTVPDSVTTIGDNAFRYCSKLASVTIPESVTTIGAEAFYGCSELASVTIPKSVTSIGDFAFDGCNNLSTVNVPCSWNENPKYTTFENSVTVDIQKHNYELGVCTACKYACTHENNKDENGICTDCYLAEGTCGENVTWVYDSKTTTLTISGTGAMADYEGDNKPWNSFKSQITNVIINNGVTTIGNYAFGECSNLKSITIPETVTTIGKYAFYGCTKLTSVAIPDSVITISANAFNGCSGLESVTIGNKVTSIGEKAFYGCSALTNVTFGENVTSFGNYAFANCTSLTTITLPEKITSVSEQCFDGCTSLASVTIPAGVTSIGAAAFSNCTNIATVTIPQGVTTIDGYAFSNCTKLQTVTIPDSVTSIGEKVFGGSTNVLLFVDENNSYLQNYATANNINYVFDGSGELGKLTFSINEDGESYSVTDCDKSILGALTIPNKFNGKSVTKIGNNAFSNCKSLTSVVIPDSVVSLGEKAFYSCGSLETVTLSSNITAIPNRTFAYCHSLKTLPITENITSIGECAFYDSGEHGSVSLSGVTIGSEAFWSCGITALTLENCKLNDASVFFNNKIKELTLSETNIPDEMFYGDSYIKTLVAEDSVLGSNSFKSCHSLKSVTVFGGEINAQAFLACSSLETVTIDNIDSVGKFAFNNCTALKTVEVNATEISEYAFSMCTSLENVKLSDNVEVIGNAVFEGCSNLKYIFFEGTEDAQKTIGDALDTNARIHYGSSTHTFNENYTVDVEPTCTEKGRESQHCKYCEETQNSKEIKENGHTSVKGGTEKAHTICGVCEEVLSATHNPTSKVTTAPTCTEEGVETFTCECGYTYTKPVATLGHDKVSHSAKSATCEAIGWYAYDTCSRCDYTTYKEIAKLGHDIVIDKAVEATCTATGLTEGSHCTRCDDKTVKQNVIPTKAHTEVTVTGKAATCTQAGLTDGKKCSVCGTVTVSQQVIAELGHDYAKDFTTDKEPTYTEAGSKSKHCSRCDAKTEVTVIAKKVLATPEVTFKATEKGMQVNWNKIDGAESYIVYKKTYNAKTKKWSGWSRIKTGVTATTYTDATVKLGTYYKYTVRAVNGDVLSKFVTLTGLKYNVTPTVKVANASNGVKVSWSTAANATGYTVYRSQYNTKTKKWSNWKNMGTAKANKTSWVDKKVTSGVSYKYTVRAVNGKILSSYKASASLMFLSQPTVKFANASTGVKVAWSKVKGATGYTVYRSELVDGKWTKWSNRGTAKANKSSWVDKKVESGVTYKYTVRAINGKVKSSFIDTKGLLYLTQPTVTVKAVSNGINVAWSQCEGATGYTVYRSEYNTKTKKWSKWSNRGTAKAEKSNWTDKKATKGVTYKYTVRAVNADTGAKSTYVASNAVKR